MYEYFLVRIPDGIVKKRTKEATYIYYEDDGICESVQEAHVPKRTSIGKQSLEDPLMMYPNQNYLNYFLDDELIVEDEEFERSSCLRIGGFLIIKKIMKDYGLDVMIDRIFGHNGDFLLDLAAYSIICENNAGQYYLDYAYNHPLCSEELKIYSNTTVFSFLSCITNEHIVSFLSLWNDKRNQNDRIYLCTNSTNKNFLPGDISLVDSLHGEEKEGLPLVTYAVAYDKNNQEPLFYEEYPSSIVEVYHLECMVETAKSYGYENVGFIFDRGVLYKGVIEYMDTSGYDFIMMVKGNSSFVSNLIFEHKHTFESNREYAIRSHKVYAKSICAPLYDSDKKERYFHLYYNSADESIERELNLSGYFVIITSHEISAEEALDLYKGRDASENLFRGDKSYIDNMSVNNYLEEPVDGKIFIEFIALIIRNKIYCHLTDEMKENVGELTDITVPLAIRELEKIEMVKHMDGIYRLDHPVTTRQKNLLKAFGLHSVDVTKEALTLGKELAKMNSSLKS